jgi:hypothetical protein
MSGIMDTSSTVDRLVPEVLAAAAALIVALAGAWWVTGTDDVERASTTAAEGAERGESASEPRHVPPVVSRETPAPVRAKQVRAREPRPGQQGANEQERLQYEPAVLQIVTNFKKADASVNSIPYPEYVEPGNEPGMVLPAGGPYNVEVTYNGNTKTYTLSLDPYEIRYLMVELSGFKGGSPAPSTENSSGDSADRGTNDEGDGKGRVTVYSKPKGGIQVDGSSAGQKTPGTIKVAPGEHSIQVDFGDGDMSESKSVRVQKGSRIKLFFRRNDSEDEDEGDEE